MLPERIQTSILEWFDKDYRATFYERIELLMESEALYKDLPYALRYGKTLEYILERMSVFIQPGERIVGSVKEIIPTDEQKAYAERLSRDWWDMEKLEDIEKQILWFYSEGWLRRRPPWFYSFGHLALDWEGILTKGLSAFEAHAREVLETPAIQADEHKINFLEGASVCYQALSTFIARYAEEARQEAERCRDPKRRMELLRIAESCEHISTQPARSFYEALQLIWFMVLPLMKVCGCGVFNLGRMDQYLYPFYQRDVESGALSDEEAVELLEEFYHKNNDILAPTDHMSDDTETTQYTLEVAYDDPNYLILGGLLKGDRPGVNELSYLFVEAAHHMKLRNPFIIIRYYPGIDQNFWLNVCDGIRDNTTLVIYNDTTMMPALRSYGVEEEDVYDYGLHGCNDPQLNANEGGLREYWFNLLRPLELALHQGEYPLEPKGDRQIEGTQYSLESRLMGGMHGPFYGIETAAPEEMRNIDDLLDAYRLQLRYLLEDYRNAFEEKLKLERVCNVGRIRIEDCFLKGTIDNAITWNDGGTKYHKVVFQGGGMASVIDSLAAIEQLVFRDKEMSLKELVDILRTNFEGQEFLQARLRKRMPKFGNDIEWVDEIGKKVVDMFCDELARVNRPEYMYTLFPAISTDRCFTAMGKGVGATPDGRGAREPISENQSPNEGADSEGLTALLNSTARLPYKRITGGPLNIRLHPSAVKGESGLQLFSSVLKTYLDKGGMQAQINIVSKEQLLEAQQNPNKYKNLCVRVTGYSAYFVQMGKQAQNELIARTEKL